LLYSRWHPDRRSDDIRVSVNTLQTPLLIYDGDCAFCCYCVDYARAATGAAVQYRPYQQAAKDFPSISEDEFRASIQLVQPDGSLSRGAEAAFRALALGGHTRFWLNCYLWLPLFAPLSEWCYRWVARHRVLCHRVCRCLLGDTLRPATMQVTSWLFLRLLALVYLAAFASFGLQAEGLIGAAGILPAAEFFRAIDLGYGVEKYWLLPSLFWISASDIAIDAAALGGCVLSLLLLVNRWPRLCLVGLYLLYLSLYHAGQAFTSFQWDTLLLECGFLAVFLPGSPRLFAWMYRWLLFRFMLQSGLVKLLSGDEHWRDLTALSYHFETQPLPTALGWYAHHLPAAILQAGVVFTFLVELVLPFFILMPRRPRAVAAGVIALFQLMIIATGNYNYFNLLTICLCLLLLDDGYCTRLLPEFLPSVRQVSTRWRLPGLAPGIAVTYLLLGAIALGFTASGGRVGGLTGQLLRWSEPFHIANRYGLFAVMTTRRPQIIFEGSEDGREWLPYTPRYQPGPLDRAPVWATPHQPRLDWQLWFAALAPRESNPWLRGLVAGLLQGSPPVVALFEHNPFPTRPPRYLRASLYNYRFTDSSTRARTGNWWEREYESRFWPVTGWQLPVEKIRD